MTKLTVMLAAAALAISAPAFAQDSGNTGQNNAGSANLNGQGGDGASKCQHQTNAAADANCRNTPQE